VDLTIQHIQDWLDRVWPGLKLEYNAVWGYWVITDYVTAPDGSPATGIFYKTPWNLLCLQHGEYTNRKLVYLLDDEDTGEPVFPTFDNIVQTLNLGYVGGSALGWETWLDRIEEQEEQRVADAKAELRSHVKDVWDEAGKAARGRTYISPAGVTETAKSQRWIEQQLAAQTHKDMELMTASALRDATQRAEARYRYAHANN
jgi:hypothetical protein